ncbi:hypothetical protein ACVI1L_004465 [Bradyrhizobium sp. USDA 4516]
MTPAASNSVVDWKSDVAPDASSIGHYIGVVSGEPHLLQPIRILDIAQRPPRTFSARAGLCRALAAPVVGIETQCQKPDTTRRYQVPAEPANSLRHTICSVHCIITNRSAMVFGTDTARVAVRVWSVPTVCCGNDLARRCGARKCREALMRSRVLLLGATVKLPPEACDWYGGYIGGQVGGRHLQPPSPIPTVSRSMAMPTGSMSCGGTTRTRRSARGRISA